MRYPCCEVCGGQIVNYACLAHPFEHYPSEPVIYSARMLTIGRLGKLPQKRSDDHSRAWARFEKTVGQHLVQQQSTSDTGLPIYHATWFSAPKTAAQRVAGRKLAAPAGPHKLNGFTPIVRQVRNSIKAMLVESPDRCRIRAQVLLAVLDNLLANPQ